MILVSVDDHVVEPPDLFEKHVPAKYKDIAPRIEHMPDGTDRWRVPRLRHPERRASTRSRAARPRNTAWTRRASTSCGPGTYDVKQPRARHVGERSARLAQLPVAPRFRGPAVRRARRQGRRARAVPRVQRLAHRRMVRRRARPLHPARDPADLGPDALADEVRRVDKQGCHAITFPENPVPLGLPSLHTDHWDPFWQACSDVGTIVNMHIGSSGQARDHRARRARRRDDHAAADEHRAGRGRPHLLAGVQAASPTSRSRSPKAGSVGSPTSSSAWTTRTRRTRRGRSPTSATSSRARCSSST